MNRFLDCLLTSMVARYGPRSWVEVHPVVLGDQLSKEAARESLAALRTQGFLFTRKAPAIAAALAAELHDVDESSVLGTDDSAKAVAWASSKPPRLLFPSAWESAGTMILRTHAI